jgi:DNA-binding response OmpR family regulator
MLTAYTVTEYLVEAIELTLIKYLIKPLNEEKLDEALEVCMLSLENKSETVVQLTKEHFYDFCNATLVCKGIIVFLPHALHKFLTLLIQNKHRAVSYQEIERKIWKDKVMTDSALRSLIHNIRKKIHPDIIENISKQGYKIKLYE